MQNISDLSDHSEIKFSINAQIREKEEIRLDRDPIDNWKDEFNLIRNNNTDKISNQLVYEKKLSESYGP